jgi:uncharacterized protein (TIGR02646 family)
MIRVNKKFAEVPKGLRSKLAVKKQKALMIDGNTHKFSTNYYGHKSVRQALEKIYYRKCAYCEGKFEDGFTLQVEHYRPKNKIKDDTQHGGYYWLTYEWSNLLLSCQDCNSKKSNKFPIAGVRVNYPQADNQQWRVDSLSFIGERALLLNPELDQPGIHFDFKPDGTLISTTPQGKATIDLCDLDRETLKLARKKVLDEAVNALSNQLEIFFDPKIQERLNTQELYSRAIELGFKSAILALKNAMQPQYPYSAFNACLFHQFELFVCLIIANKFGKEFSDVLTEAYKQFAN